MLRRVGGPCSRIRAMPASLFMLRSWGTAIRLIGGVLACGRTRPRVVALSQAYRHSEIRLVRTRDFGVLSGVVFMRVFGADNLLPLSYQRAPIRFGRRPRHRENAFILDRKMKLKPLAPIVGVRCPAT